MRNLVIIKLTEIPAVDFAFCCIRHRGQSIQLYLRRNHLFHRANHIAELSDTGGLNQNSIRRQLHQHLFQRLLEITDKAATNTTGVHFSDFDACLLQKTAVDTHLSEFVFNQHQLLACIGLGNQFFDERRFPRAKKTGEHINFRHIRHSFLLK